VSKNYKHHRLWLLSLLIVAITAAASSAQNRSASFATPQQRLGAPGPENLTSPTRANLAVLPIDSSVTSSASPNRTRDLTSNPGDNSTFGTLTMQRRIQNNTGQPITRLRFRIVELTTFPSSGPQADIRALTSASASVMNVNRCGDLYRRGRRRTTVHGHRRRHHTRKPRRPKRTVAVSIQLCRLRRDYRWRPELL
jgi:hypothetical protein